MSESGLKNLTMFYVDTRCSLNYFLRITTVISVKQILTIALVHQYSIYNKKAINDNASFKL